MSESIDTLKLLVTKMRIKKAIEDIRNKGDLLIGGKSFIEIVFVSFPPKGIRTNATTRY
jgi:hypothetical protein